MIGTNFIGTMIKISEFASLSGDEIIQAMSETDYQGGAKLYHLVGEFAGPMKSGLVVEDIKKYASVITDKICDVCGIGYSNLEKEIFEDLFVISATGNSLTIRERIEMCKTAISKYSFESGTWCWYALQRIKYTSGLPATIPSTIFDIRFIAPSASVSTTKLKLSAAGSAVNILTIGGKVTTAGLWANGAIVQITINNTGATFTATLSGGGSGGGHVISSSEPADTSVMWIDSTNGYLAKVHNGTAWVAISAAWG